MKNNIKRFLSIILVVAVIMGMTVACGSKKEDMAEPEEMKAGVSEEQTEESETEEVEKQEEEPVDDTTEISEAQRAAQEEREAIERYNEEVLGMDPIDPNEKREWAEMAGIPDEKMQELYDAVRNSVTERYLTKYNISLNDFEWPENVGGKGEPKPWGYLSGKVTKKAATSWGNDDEPDEDPSEYNVDPQTAELMDCVYRPIVNWLQSNNYDRGLILTTDWSDVIIPYVTFG